MRHSMRHPKRLATALALATLTATPALAETHLVQMLNRDAAGNMMVFEPAYLEIAPGDSVTFVPTERSHNAESMDDMLPQGAEGWTGKRDEEITVSFDVPGYYGYKCKPHEAMGMVGLIRVGDPETLPEVGKLRGKGDDRMQELLAQAGA